MHPILISGYRPQYDTEKLKGFVKRSECIAPMARAAALDLLEGLTIDQMMSKYNRGKGYTTTLRARGRLILTLILAVSVLPQEERFGLERIPAITEGMTTSELASHCGVSNPIILSLVRRYEKFGLPLPEERAQGWWFSAKTANLYIGSLGR